MPTVILVNKDGQDVPVTTTRGFIEAVYGRGMRPKVGSIASNYDALLGGGPPTGNPVSYLRLADLMDPASPAVAAIRGGLVPRWAANTPYGIGELVVNPSGQFVTAIAAFTSGATYDSTKWNLVRTITSMYNARSLTEDKLSVPLEGTNGQVLTYDPTQAGQMKWAAIPTQTGGGGPSAPAGNSITGLVAGSTASAVANSAALAAWVADNSASRGPTLAFRTPGIYYFKGEMDCTNATNPVRELFIGQGVELVQTNAVVNTTNDGRAYGPWFKGSLENTAGTPNVRFFTADVNRGSWTIPLDSVTGIYGEGPDEAVGTPARDMLSPGTQLYLFSDDFIHDGGKYRNCALRRVVTVVGNTVTLDSPLYRNWTTANNAAAVVVNPHPSVLVHGPGRVYHNNPWANTTFFGSLMRFEFVNGVTVRDVTLGPGPGNGVELFSVWGADVAPNTQHLLSDDAQGNNADTWHPNNLLQTEHYGYGVLQGGGTRSARITGTAHHVRHSHTTGASPDTVMVSALKSVVNASGKPGAALSNPGNCGDPEMWHVAIRPWATWQQSVDTHESGHHGTIELLTPGGGTWDDTLEEANQGSVSIRCQDVTVTGQIGGSKEFSVYVYQATQTHPEWGETVLSNLRIGPSAEAIRFQPGPGTRLRMSGVSTYGCERFLYVRSANAFTLLGEGNYADGTAAPETVSKALIWFDAVVTANPIDLGLDWSGYTTAIKYNGAPITQADIRLRRRSDVRGLVIQHDLVKYPGTGWPATRPLVPGGDLRAVATVSGTAGPTWLIKGDRYTVKS